MEITEQEASVILELTASAWDEGQGSKGDDALVNRIIEAYPNIKVPRLVELERKH